MMARHNTPETVQRVVHALLRRSPVEQGVVYRATPAELALVPPHKRLANAPAGCGIPIGNLSSQFFANVYLNELDQFVKHTLRCKRYARYVDDFILIHQDRGQLERWQLQIEAFLAAKLQLRLKDDIRLRPLTDGIDFLGYVIRPSHLLVRRRVVAHCREALAAWEDKHVSAAGQVTASVAERRQATAVWRSYQGHFAHAQTWHLQTQIRRRFPWLEASA